MARQNAQGLSKAKTTLTNSRRSVASPFYKKQADGSLRHETELIVDRGIEFVKSQPNGKPFALNMWFNACHAEDSDRRPGIGHFPWPLGCRRDVRGRRYSLRRG